MSNLRNISQLLTFDKIAEQLVAELIISDMHDQLHPSQYANQKGVSLEHYLMNLVHKILTDSDDNSAKEINAMIATLYNWKEAFPRQCPKLSIEAFICCRVRASIIPLLISYLQDWRRNVKCYGETSETKDLNGAGPQGAKFGIWEYLAQSNNNANCVPTDSRFKFVDDLTVLEKINLIMAGLCSYNIRRSVPSDIPTSNIFIQSTTENLSNI